MRWNIPVKTTKKNNFTARKHRVTTFFSIHFAAATQLPYIIDGVSVHQGSLVSNKQCIVRSCIQPDVEDGKELFKSVIVLYRGLRYEARAITQIG